MINKVIILGNLGKDPEMRSTGSKQVANFSIATTESYKDKAGAKQTTTTWHNIVAWSPLAEICEKYLKKGSQVYIEGKISNRSYENKEGTKVYVSEIVAGTLKMLGGNKDAKNTSEGKSEPAYMNDDLDQDDLPF
jgi:single-strand DNA-binding protein